MSTHLDAGLARWSRLAHFGLLRFTGADAATFLQGQISNDTRRLSQGAPLLASYSTPQGRVVAVLHFLPHSTGLIALLPRELAAPTRDRLGKYVMRSKVQIEDLSERFAVLGALAGDTPATPGYVERDGVGMAPVGTDASRQWAIGSLEDLRQRFPPPADESDPAGAADAAAENAWRLADIRAGLPQVHAATSEMFVAQMLNLDLVDGISFTKGCFTGQEIIARTQHLGRIKRRMARLRLPAGEWRIGQAVHLADGRSGHLIELAHSGAEIEALAVLNEAAAPATDALIDAAELPLPYAPAR